MNKKIFKYLGYTLIGVLIAVGLFVAVLLITQYNPEDFEIVSTEKSADKIVNVGDTVKIITWNIGYGALGEKADFFMDGGKMVNTATKEEVMTNIENIGSFLSKSEPDIVLLQEVDVDSSRSWHINEVASINKSFPKYINTFAYNFKVLYIPYPIPNIGEVNGGVATFQRYKLNEADRIQLYCPFNKLVRAFNLRRCLLVNRIPIENSDKELVVVNLHLEAYDSGVGKIEQAKELRNLIQSEYERGNYVIAGGDFNQIFSDIYEDTKFMFEESAWKPACFDVDELQGFTSITDTTTPTCRSLHAPYYDGDKNNFPAYIIDGFLVSDNIEILSVETVDLEFENTDHNPVVLQVKLKGM